LTIGNCPQPTAQQINADLAKIRDLGGGKPRSVIYTSKYCPTPEAIDYLLNQDAYAYTYIYWIPQAKGVIITLGKPNPDAFDQPKQSIIRGYELLSEADAGKAIENTFSSMDAQAKENAEIAMIRLYDNGFVLCKKTDQKGNP